MRIWLMIAAAIGMWLGGAALAQEDGEVVEVQMITENGENYFEPAGLHVEPGTTIRFVNASGSHNSASYSEDNDKPQRIPEGAEGWSSPVFSEEGATFEVTLEEEGVYDYYCLPHEALGMVGRIIVGDAEAAPAQPAEDLQFPDAQQALPSVDAILGDDDGRLTREEMNQ